LVDTERELKVTEVVPGRIESAAKRVKIADTLNDDSNKILDTLLPSVSKAGGGGAGVGGGGGSAAKGGERSAAEVEKRWNLLAPIDVRSTPFPRPHP
jgi:hypothetical protein